MFEWLKGVLGKNHPEPSIGWHDVDAELEKRAPHLVLYWHTLRYQRDCDLCEKLGLPKPVGSDLIWVTEKRILDAMREQDWHEVK